MTLDPPCEFLEVVEVFVKDPSDHIEIDRDVVVHEHVAETCDASKSRAERGRQYAGIRETIDRRGVVRGVETGRGREMGRDIDGVLGAELESVFDRPTKIHVRAQHLGCRSAVATQIRERLTQRREVTLHHRGVGASGTHEPWAAAERFAASIFASCGTKSQ